MKLVVVRFSVVRMTPRPNAWRNALTSSLQKMPLVLKSPKTNFKGKLLSIKIVFAFEKICKFRFLFYQPLEK